MHDHKSMHERDGMAENHQKQTYKGSTNHIRAIPQGSGIQR